MDLSIVTTLYASARHLEEFYARACAAAEGVTSDFEIILVNDGSPDNSLDIALSIHKRDPRVRVIDLSRNFGHHKAMMTGLIHARGELVFLIDSDLEEEPELLVPFYQELKAKGAEVVYGVQQKRKGKFFERVSGTLFFKVFNLLSTYPIPPNLITARLMTRRYVVALTQHKEREFVMAGLWTLAGFNQIPINVRKQHKGATSYGPRRKLAHLVNAVTSFSSKPLVLIFYLGFILIVVSSLAAFDLIIRRIFFGVLLEGWASLIVSIWLLGGITIFCLGVIAIYLSKIFIEVKQRPYAIVRDIYEAKEPPSIGRNRMLSGPSAQIERQSDNTIRGNVEDYYSKKIEAHGATAHGADWSSPDSQRLRFVHLLNVIDRDQPFTINDYGCGYGALADYLKSESYAFQYSGFDISPKMIAKADELHAGMQDVAFVSREQELGEADYTVASGIFNVKLQASDKEWEGYMLRTLGTISRLSRRGFAFNVLTKYSDLELRRPDLYYADPLFLFDYCKTTFSRFVTLLHDYPLYEFTVLIRKE